MSMFRADRYVASVDRIDVDELRESGIRCVLVDRDNTLVPRDTKVAPPEVVAWLDRVREAGIATCMVSNNFHTKAVCDSARELGCSVVHHSMKPAPIAIDMALAMVGVAKEQTVLVGDQIFTDVLAGNLAGVKTVLVRPQTQVDLWYTHIFRLGEYVLLRNVHFDS